MFRLSMRSTQVSFLMLGLMVLWIVGEGRVSPGAEQHLDVRRAQASTMDRALSSRTSEILRMAARQFGGGIIPAFDGVGRLRGLARHSPPLSPPDSRDAETIGRAFARAHGYLLAIDDAWIRNLELVARDRSGPNALLRFRQQWAGIPVFQSDLRIQVAPAGEVVEVLFSLESLPPSSESPQDAATITPESALLSCLAGLEPALPEPRIELREPQQGSRHRVNLRLGPSAEEVIAQWVWFPAGGQLRLAWQFNAVSLDLQTYYECVVDARDGTLLYRNSITDSEVIGLVYDRASPQPSATPGIVPPKPDPPFVIQRTYQSFAGDSSASPAGWVGPDMDTIGNNVIAREDKAGDNETTLGFSARAANGIFSFDLLVGPAAPWPVAFTEAAITNLFYWCNAAHDYFYKLGFTEEAGNFQEDNFGKGGLAQDALRADAQDGIEKSPPNLNNANMSTPADGSKPRMQMYLWGLLGGPYADSDLDAEVILHEYTHGVFRRLIPTIGGIQGGAMNEGNSDFFALNYFTPAGAPPDGSYIAGSFSDQDFASGIRSRPYSTNLSMNDLSYADFGRVRGYPEVHADGEIWVQAMWELRARLIKNYGFDEGRHRVAQLMIDAMKRSPQTPSFVDMRDALIGADQANNKGADAGLIWEAFARRGMGFMAAGGSGSSLAVLPSTDLPSASGKVRFFEDILFVGETVRAYIGDGNNAEPTFSLPLETRGGDSETLTFNRSGAIYQASMPTAGGSVTKNDGKLQLAPGDSVRVLYHDVNDGTGRQRDVAAEAQIRAAYETETVPGSLETLAETPLNLKGDNSTRQYSLPFGFPFYNRLISSVHISTNGLITISLPNGSSSNSESTLKNYAAIAPLWMDLRTNGTIVPLEDVYVAFPTPDSIRFRWVAESAKRLAVNVAVTLFRNGDILFQYGAGNRQVTPTVGISRGNEACMQIYGDYSVSDPRQSKTLENAVGVRWIYPGNNLGTTVFPFLKTTENQYSGYGVVNYGDKPADILFLAHQDDGQPFSPAVNPQSYTLPGGAQNALVATQIFPALPRVFEGWVEARSTDSRLAAFFLTGDGAQTFLSGAPPPARLSKDLIFTHLPAGSNASPGTMVYIVNPGEEPANLELRWHAAEESAFTAVERTLAPHSRLAAALSTLFTSLPQESSSGYLRITSNAEVAAAAFAQGSDAPYMISAQEPRSAATLYAAQFAVGKTGGVTYSTTVNLVNSSTARRTVTISLIGNDGLPISAMWINNPRTIGLEPGGQIHMRGNKLFGIPEFDSPARFLEGTLAFRADGGGIVGDITFEEAITHQFSASIPLDPAERSDLIFGQVAEGQVGNGKPYFTGIAILNPNAGDVSVRVQVFSRGGLPAAEVSLMLKPGARISRTLAELLPGLNQIGGYIRVSSSGGPVSSFVLYGTSSLDFLAAVPPQFIDR